MPRLKKSLRTKKYGSNNNLRTRNVVPKAKKPIATSGDQISLVCCPVCKLVYTYGYANCKAGRRCRSIYEETTDENVALTSDFDGLLRSSYGGDPKW
ncbi:hypothetical protein KY285_031547 [Solanum tuberosum]|nr:hypothetical protein KY285_031547 [Solanum tuberosum]